VITVIKVAWVAGRGELGITKEDSIPMSLLFGMIRCSYSAVEICLRFLELDLALTSYNLTYESL